LGYSGDKIIKLQFFDYGCGHPDIEGELGITEDIDDLLISHISEGSQMKYTIGITSDISWYD
jgi:hypothetical protein